MTSKLWIFIVIALIVTVSAQEEEETLPDEREDEIPIEETKPAPEPEPEPEPERKVEPVKPSKTNEPKKRTEVYSNPCAGITCKRGESCYIRSNDPKAYDCRCTESCTEIEYSDPICSSNNRTFNTECDFYRMQCLCKKNDPECTSELRSAGDWIAHYSSCHETFCDKDIDYEDYPSRLGQWLQVIFFEKARMTAADYIDELDILQPLSGADRRLVDRMHALTPGPNNAVNATFITWWFCNLDSNSDRTLDRKEYAMLIRALVPSDQCIGTFFSKADTNNNKQITIDEWYKAFDIKADRRQSCSDVYRM